MIIGPNPKSPTYKLTPNIKKLLITDKIKTRKMDICFGTDNYPLGYGTRTGTLVSTSRHTHTIYIYVYFYCILTASKFIFTFAYKLPIDSY